MSHGGGASAGRVSEVARRSAARRLEPRAGTARHWQRPSTVARQRDALAMNMEGAMKVTRFGEANHLSWLADM